VTSEQTSQLKSDLEARLTPYGQSHVLKFWDKLDPEAQEKLSDQIFGYDLEQLGQLFEQKESTNHWDGLAKKASVPPAITLANFANAESYDAAWQTGAELLEQGKVGMIITAGGQGSRLGFDHPKGMFPIGPISGMTLFQIFFEKVMARANQFGSKVPIYHDGKLLLSDVGEIFASPDGHGGALLALQKSGALDDMQKRGVEHVFYGQIDNPLVQVCDPALLGYHAKSKSEMTSQVVRKTDPLQKVGNVVSVGGVVQIIEYSDLSETFARETRADGKLKLWAGSIAVHIFKTDFFLRMSETADSLPFHRANKKVPFVDADGKRVTPDDNNAIKFEKFIFDLLPSAKNAIICEVDPADGFCAVKNAPPATAETPDHVKQAISDLHTRWFKEAGVDVADGVTVEISPLLAADAKVLKEKIAADPSLGEPISKNTYFQQS